MSILNRLLVIVISLLWCAAWSSFLVLMWAPRRIAEVDFPNFLVTLDVASSGAERILGTLVVGALITIGIGFFLLESKTGLKIGGPKAKQAPPDEPPQVVALVTDLRQDLHRLEAQLTGISEQLREAAPSGDATAQAVDAAEIQGELQRISAALADISQQFRQSDPIQWGPTDRNHHRKDKPPLIRRIWRRLKR